MEDFLYRANIDLTNAKIHIKQALEKSKPNNKEPLETILKNIAEIQDSIDKFL